MENNKSYTIYAILFISLLILVSFILARENNGDNDVISKNVQIIDNIQIVNIEARAGGYFPKKTYIMKGFDTRLIISSKNSYGCEGAFTIPSLNVEKTLPSNGDTEFNLGVINSNLLGTCDMGMYRFTLEIIP